MKQGTTARLIVPEIKGTVIERRINPLTDELEVLLSWTEKDGQQTQRWFDATQLEAVEAA